jgi:hypothetical protein
MNAIKQRAVANKLDGSPLSPKKNEAVENKLD